MIFLLMKKILMAKNPKKNKEKYTLGVLVGGVHTYFPKEHIKGISEAAKEMDVKI